MPPRVKQALIWALVIFVVYVVVASPDRAADTVHAGWRFVASAFTGVNHFFSALAA